MKNRLYIDSDVINDDELTTSQRRMAIIFEKEGTPYNQETVFDETRDFAWHKAADAWEAVKRADEISKTRPD